MPDCYQDIAKQGIQASRTLFSRQKKNVFRAKSMLFKAKTIPLHGIKNKVTWQKE